MDVQEFFPDINSFIGSICGSKRELGDREVDEIMWFVGCSNQESLAYIITEN